MGNIAMCAPSIISNNEVKILSSDGRLLIYASSPMKAAEIMLENPGQFLCESNCLKVGQRIPGMCAEEELERGHVYFLLPMDMLYSVLTNEELKLLSHKTSRGMKQALKIFPEFCLFPNAVEDADAISADSSQQGERYSRQRSWQPALETILETQSHS